MKRPKIRVKEVTLGGVDMLNLELQVGNDPGLDVVREFITIAEEHSLPPEGGCYEVQAVIPNTGGETISFLKGMYVQPGKYKAVLADLDELGYEIEHAA